MGLRISVFGLGYVGSVTASCLAARGCRVTGVDVHPNKVAQVNAGRSPIVEPGLAERVREQRDAGRLSATTDAAQAVRETDLSLVCVGTPSLPSGALDLSQVEKVAAEIAGALQAKPGAHTLIVRSTMLPGSTRRLCRERFASLMALGNLRVYFFPEFLRQGAALQDFDDPSLAVLGAASAGEEIDAALAGILGQPPEVVTFEEAELLKYACNAFHAAKVGFANEIGRIGKAVGLDGARVMRLLCQDRRLNISPYYLRPGTPFGGSCLPKDVGALSVFARSRQVATPLLDSLLISNERHLQLLLELVERRECRQILLLGLAFKPDTDDLRGSAMLELAAALLLRGFEVAICDPLVSADQLTGANERFARLRLPNLASLLTTDLAGAVRAAGTIVASKKCAALADLEAVVEERHHLIDVNGWPELKNLRGSYEGFCW